MFLFNRYIFGFLFAIGLIILIIVILTSGPSTPKHLPRPLVSYANSNSMVEMDIYGPIVAGQNHNQVNMTVNQYYASLYVYQGYNFNQIRAKSYTNTLSGYKAFLAALNFAGYNTGTTNPKITSSLGYCALGDVYTFKLINNGQLVSSYWETSCSGDPVTYDGNFSRTFNLFQAQIPDYNALTSGANI